MPRSGAERQQLCRKRARSGLVTYQLVLNEIDTCAMLIAGGLLGEHEADDHEKVVVALEQQISNLNQIARDA